MLMSYHCHCKDCQQLSGTGHLSLFVVPETSLTVSGTLKFYNKTSDSGNGVKLGFCPNCGANILGKPAAAPGMVALAAGSLLDTSQFKPSMEQFTASAPSWDALSTHTIKHAGPFERE